MAQVVQRLEHRRGVVADLGRLRQVAHLELDPVLDVGRRRPLRRAIAIEVSSMSKPCTTASGYRRARASVDQPAAAGQVRDAGRAGAQPVVDLRDGGQPAVELVGERRPVERRLGVDDLGRVVRPGDRPRRCGRPRPAARDMRPSGRQEAPRSARRRRGASGPAAPGRRPRAACNAARPPSRGLDLEDAGDRLLLEPLAGVALGHPGRARPARCWSRAVLVQRGVQAEPLAQPDREEVHRPEGGLEEPADERLDGGTRLCRRARWCSLGYGNGVGGGHDFLLVWGVTTGRRQIRSDVVSCAGGRS